MTAAFSTNDPPTCHLQAMGRKDGYPIQWFTKWVDGDKAAAARPDVRSPGMTRPQRVAFIESSRSLMQTNLTAEQTIIYDRLLERLYRRHGR